MQAAELECIVTIAVAESAYSVLALCYAYKPPTVKLIIMLFEFRTISKGPLFILLWCLAN